MCPCSITFVCPVYSGPARNVSRCDMVGGPGESARYTVEQVPRLAVGLSDVAARRTGSACVARIDLFEGDAGKPALIGDLLLEVVECPGMQDAPLAFASRDAGADALQILKSNSSSGAFSRGANLFGNLVVDVAGEAMFPPAQAEQNTLGAARAFSLETLALPPAPRADARNLRGVAINPAIRVGGYVDQTKVNAKPAQGFFLAGLRHVNRNVEEPLAMAENQIRLAFGELEQVSLALAACERQALDSAVNRPNTNRRCRELKIKDAAVVGDATVLSEFALNSLVQFVGVGHLGVESDNHLSRQGELPPNLPIEQPVHRELPEFLSGPGQFREPIAGSVDRLHRLSQRHRLLLSRQELDLDSQRHGVSLSQTFENVYPYKYGCQECEFRIDFFGPESQSVLPKANAKPFQVNQE